jgi:hypothetical protein
MLAATSWAARLKAGLARTREVLNTDLGTLLSRRKIDDALFDELETALLSADCGVDATRSVLDELRAKVKQQGIEDGATLKAALKASLLARLAPLERRLDAGARKPCVIMVAGRERLRQNHFHRQARQMAAGRGQQSDACGRGTPFARRRASSSPPGASATACR